MPDLVADWPQPYALLDALPYWEGLAAERLLHQQCIACGFVVWPAHSHCPECSARELTWHESSGRGRVYTWSTVFRGPTPLWATIAPYTVGFVEMDEGYLLFAQIGGDPDDLQVGTEVRVRFIERGEQKLPVFVRAEAPA